MDIFKEDKTALQELIELRKKISENIANIGQPKICISAVDPNDLQPCDHRKWEASTDSCAICGKDWGSIMWNGGGKPCCGGINAGAPTFYVNGAWHSADCDSLKPPIVLPEHGSPSSIDYRPKSSYKRCECGAASTTNPNCHATYCPEYKK